ncbi:MAG: hypothetical protein H6840_04510 [Planctomycetes bacterium]|nr:hypothetical protein [Planctomycetota bacterium]
MHRPNSYRWSLLLCLLAASLLAVSFTPAGTVRADDDFKSLKKEYEQAKSDGKPTTMGRLIEKMAQANDKDAAKYLLGELADDQRARKSKKAGLPGDIRDKIVNALAAFTDEESVGLIGKAALDLKSDKDPVLALDQFDFFKSLARMDGVEAADKTIRAALADPKNPYIKCAALEAVRQAKAGRFLDDVVNILLEENQEWAKKWLIVPINTLACLEDIVDTSNKEAKIKVVEAVIVWEERKWCLDERVRFFGGKMLAEVTGEAADMGSTFYWKWWVAQMKAVGAVDNSSKPEGKRSKTAAVPPVFDTAPVGKRFVFVIDVSDSMKLPLKISLEEIEKRKKESGPVSGRRKGEKAPDEGEEEKDPDADNPLRQLPWKEIHTKIELAREELSRAIKTFVGDREFAIITYSTEVELITNGWVKATPSNCAKWSDEAKELEPVALTNIHGGLMRALRLSAKGDDAAEPAVDPDCVLTGADSIVFLTDGWASWDDQSQGKTKDKRNNVDNSVGDGPFIYGEDIWPDIVRHNLFRKVIINTVGIGNHDQDLLRNLAKRTGGTYVDWSFPED